MAGEGTRLFGTEEAEPEVRLIECGEFCAELIDGQVGAVRFGGVEVIRGIAWLVRDSNWGTLPIQIGVLHFETFGAVTRVTYTGKCRNPGGERLQLAAAITIAPKKLEFVVEAVALDDFTTNRTGFIMLHPLAASSAELSVEHGSGVIDQARFPDLIDPACPFTDIRALTHRYRGLTTACRFEGEVFEMEDHRNWSDASFKTYARPLAKPWPYVLKSNEVVRQVCSVSIAAKDCLRGSGSSTPCMIALGKAVGKMPAIGLGIAPSQAVEVKRNAPLLSDVGVQDLLLEFNAAMGDGQDALDTLAAAVAGQSARLTLECVIAADGDVAAEMREIAKMVRKAELDLDAVSVFPVQDLQSTPPGSEWPACPDFETIFPAARAAFPKISVGGGMYNYFTELNRKRVPSHLLDFVTHATCPIVHAAHDRSVMQSMGAVRDIVRSARALYPESEYRIGPVSIGMRQNPYGSQTLPNPSLSRLPMAEHDPRQEGEFAKAWTLAYAAATEEAKLSVLTFGSVTGPRGVIGESGPRPAYDAVRALASMAGEHRRQCTSSDPDKVVGICAGSQLTLVNLSSSASAVEFPGGQTILPPFGTFTHLLASSF